MVVQIIDTHAHNTHTQFVGSKWELSRAFCTEWSGTGWWSRAHGCDVIHPGLGIPVLHFAMENATRHGGAVDPQCIIVRGHLHLTEQM